MPDSKSDAPVVETPHVTVTEDEFGNQKVTPKALADNTPVEDKDGNMILSQAIRDDQKKAGLMPDIQPKIAPVAVEVPVGDPTKTQPTGNVTVAYAVNATPADVGQAEEKDKK